MEVPDELIVVGAVVTVAAPKMHTNTVLFWLKEKRSTVMYLLMAMATRESFISGWLLEHSELSGTSLYFF